MHNAYFNCQTTAAVLSYVVISIVIVISAELTYFLISEEKSTGFINNVISFCRPLAWNFIKKETLADSLFNKVAGLKTPPVAAYVCC